MAYSLEIKGVDKTSLLKTGSLRVSKGVDNRSECSLSLITDSTYSNIAGLDLKIKDGASTIFGGVVKTAPIDNIEGGIGVNKKLRIDVTSNGYNDILSRRTTSAYYTNKYAGEIVTALLASVLNVTGASESIGTGTISNGLFYKVYAITYKTIKEVLDELAEASGFKWYISDSRALYFIAEDAIVDASHAIEEGGVFTDYTITGFDVSLDNYRNKQFVTGGTGADGKTIQVVVSNDTEIAARKTAEGSTYSSGVYGNVLSDSNIKTVAEATTVAQNELKKYGVMPATLNFTSRTNDWVAGTKLKVNLPTYGISSDEYFLIESVEITAIDPFNLVSNITATRRNSASFSTQRTENYIDFFSKIVKKDEVGNSKAVVYDEDGTAYSMQIYVQPDTPTSANEKDLWVDTDDWSRYDKLALSGATTLTVDSFEFVTVSGTFDITLHVATSAGIIKKIYNIGTGIVTIIGTINGVANKLLYPNEAITLITDGTGWRC